MPKTFEGLERRKCPRLDEKMPLVYQTHENLEGKTCSTKNISSGGFCFETERPVYHGDVLWVQIYKPVETGLTRRAPISTIAKVAWVRRINPEKYESGLEFVDIRERDREEIAEHVERKHER